MTLTILTIILTSLTSILLFVPQPLLFGLIMLILATFLAVTIRFSFSPWYAYTFFIIFIGGLLVIFAYVSALSPNYIHPYPPTHLLLQTFLIMLPLTMFFVTTSPCATNSMGLIYKNIFKTANDIYSPVNYILLMLLILMLLLVLTLVVKISNLTKGPLRPFFCLLSIFVRLPSKWKAYLV